METENAGSERNEEEEQYETGVYWTPELNIEFIRMRKSFGEATKFAKGRKKGSLNKEGWRQLILAMGLEGKLTANQGKQRWNNFVNKYKYEKDPTRIGKPANTPITWPLFHMMDWAVGDRLEQKSYSHTTSNNEVPDAVASIPEMDAGPSTSADESHNVISAQRLVQQDITIAHQSDSSSAPGAIHVNTRPASRMSVSTRHQRTARLLEAEEACIDNELNSIRVSLNDLAELQREKCDSMRKNAEENMKMVNSIDKLVDASGRQARALERFSEILNQIDQYDESCKEQVCTIVLQN